MATVAQKYPTRKFAITDYPVDGDPLRQVGKLTPNVLGIPTRRTRRAASSACSRRKMAEKTGKKIIGAVGGIKIPPVDIWIAGYKYCAKKAVPGHEGRSINYSQDFVDQATSARRRRRTRSRRARRCSSRSPASAASAR